jgi:hypothetical protein
MEIKENILENREHHLLININSNHNLIIKQKDILLEGVLQFLKKQNKMVKELFNI